MAQTDAGGMFFKVSAIVDKNSFEQSQRSVGDLDVSFNKLIGTVRNAGVVLAGIKAVKAVSGIGELETQSYKTSVALGISSDAFRLWSASAKIAGVNADSLFNSMGKVGSVLKRLKIDGAGANELAKKLGVNLKLGNGDLQNSDGSWMSADKAFEAILKRAEKMVADGMELSEVYLRLQETIGSEGADFFAELQREGLTLDEFMKGASKKVLTNDSTDAASQGFAKEVRELKTTFDELKKVTDSAIAGALTPALKLLNDWLDKNGPVIKTGLEAFSKWATQSAEEGHKEVLASSKVAPITNMMGNSKFSPEMWAEFYSMGASESEIADYKKQLEIVQVLQNARKKNFRHKDTLEENEITEEVAKAIEQYLSFGGDFDSIQMTAGAIKVLSDKYGIKRKQEDAGDWWKPYQMNDGIMRPDGTVTQVAPDDWVFAARNLGDLAKAFTPEEKEEVAPPIINNRIDFTPAQKEEEPHVVSNRINEITQNTIAPADNTVMAASVINEQLNELTRYVGMLSMTYMPQQQAAVSNGNFTINQTFNINGGNDMPQVLRQQAYKGAQEGLLDVMNESSRRLQLMSGTR